MARPYLEPAAPVAKQPLTVKVRAYEGERLSVEWTLASGQSVTTASENPLPHANSRALNHEVLVQQLGRPGKQSLYIGRTWRFISQARPSLPASVLNQLEA